MTWPSSYAPGTMGYLVDRIDDEIKRSGTINDRIQTAIVDSINIYNRERFRFNETFTTTFYTVGGQQNYNIFSDFNFPSVGGPQQIYKIDWVTITIPPAVFDMPRYQPEEILILTQTGTQMGQPYAYAFSNEQIMLYPIPPTGTPGTGPVASLTGIVGGSGYAPGTYSAIQLIDATTPGASGIFANIFVNGAGSVQSVTLVQGGQGAVAGDLLHITLGIGTGFSATVAAVNANGQGPFLMSIGAHVNIPSPTPFPSTAANSNIATSGAATTGVSITGNRWFSDGEKLIRSRAKYELAINVLRDKEMAQMMSPHPPELNGGVTGAAYDAYEMLNAEMNRLMQRGQLRPSHF
jgi:hypothetical protein